MKFFESPTALTLQGWEWVGLDLAEGACPDDNLRHYGRAIANAATSLADDQDGGDTPNGKLHLYVEGYKLPVPVSKDGEVVVEVRKAIERWLTWLARGEVASPWAYQAVLSYFADDDNPLRR